MITVRPAREQDSRLLEAVWHASFMASYATFMPESYVRGVLESDVIGKLARKKWDECFIAEVDGQPGAVMQLTDNYVAELWTHPDHQKKGAASALLDHAEKMAAQRGFDTLTLCTYGRNTQAREFYRKRGFAVHRTEASDRVPDDIVCHKVKRLAG
ncbi:GNAT family N-acetyltransferase [Pseudodesulfovibrio senegalensis]|uniref:GNAT family N-acetyltransferase n=1 Tax=Pseudodesulfovibrio senegalensis TaxID=1721087 RepID=UPI0013759CC0|nr:GNAT family N-acetyltransferase [Pseudodesulfovibrio senegalensis]